jgi:dTDP-4-amino-4,6-dideoxygalactose transaminase
VNSGTAGLHLCVHAAGVKEADLVITTPFSFVASTNVLLFERAVPVFVDVDPHTGNIDPKLVRQAAVDLMQGGAAATRWLPRSGGSQTAKLKAILPVECSAARHMDPIRAVANDYDLKIIEDFGSS